MILFDKVNEFWKFWAKIINPANKQYVTWYPLYRKSIIYFHENHKGSFF